MGKILGCVLLLLLAAASPATAAERYSVQVATVPTLVGANLLKTTLTTAGFQPVNIIAENGSVRVCFGAFDTYVDALLYKEHLRTNPLFPDAHITKINATDQAVISTKGIIPPVFKLPAVTVDGLPLQTLAGVAAYEELEAIDRLQPKEVYEQALLAKLPACSQNDPLKGYILTNLGVIEIVKGDYDTALERLLPVANGQVPSAAAHRVMAMIRVAWIHHQQGDRVRSYQAYREIEKFSKSASVIARCKADRMGLLLELSESGKGTHEEFRSEAAKQLAMIGADQQRYRAVIELMVFESYARQPEPDVTKAAQLADAFVEKYSASGVREQVQRELAAGMAQAGMFHAQLGDFERAKYYYNRVLSEVPVDVEQFKGAHPHAEAMLGLSNVARKEGRISESNRIRAELIARFPNEEAAKSVVEIQPYLVKMGVVQ